MQDIELYLNTQYSLVQQSRAKIFEYCKTISTDDFVNENTSFGLGGSIRNLLIHVADTYKFWIQKRALNKSVNKTQYSSMRTISEIENLYRSVDNGVLEFIERYQSTMLDTIRINKAGVDHDISPLELFTHVTTHEFHHKGQILSLSRHLGYTPIDSDIITF